MKLESTVISSKHFMFSVACFIQASALLSAFFFPVIQHEAWLSELVGKALFVPVVLLFVGLARLYPQKTIIEIYEAVFGRIGGSVVSVITVLSFLTLSSLNLRDFGQLVKQTMMVDTPPVALTSLCILVCAYAVYHGLKTVTRFSLIFALLAVCILAIASLLTIEDWNMAHFLPLFDQPVLNYIQSIHISATVPTGELLLFMMVMPYVKCKPGKGKTRYFLGGFIIGSLTIISVVVRDTAVLGNTISLLATPPFETLRMATFVEGISRLEVFFLISMIILLFFKVLIWFYVSVMALSQLFKLKSYHPMILVTGAFIVAYSIFVFPSAPVHMAFGHEHTATLWTFLSIVIPLITWITAVLRNKNNGSVKEGAT